MKIKRYEEKDGDVSFLVDSEMYQKILAHLRFKKLNAGGNHSDTSFSNVVVAATIQEVNEALKDFGA